MAHKDPNQSGAEVITPPSTVGQKVARRVLRRMPNGKMGLVFMDIQTGEILTDTTGYTIENNQNYSPGNTQASQNQNQPQQSGSSGNPILDQLRELGGGGIGLSQSPYAGELSKVFGSNFGQQQGSPLPQLTSFSRQERADDPDTNIGAGTYSRDPSNNFGYINKPGGLGMMSMLGGPLGLAGKAVNAGINTNNMMATNAARGMMGVPPTSGLDTVKGLVKDNQGQVGNFDINDNTYSVGLEAMSPSGMTNLTPNEARTRGLTLGGIGFATPDQVTSQQERFAADTGRTGGGLFGGILDSARSFIDSMYDGVSSVAGKFGSGFGGYSSRDYDFSRPATSYTGSGQMDRGLSPAASEAIGRGGGGLY